MNNSYETDRLSPHHLANFDPNHNYSPKFVITGATAKTNFAKAQSRAFRIKPTRQGETDISSDSKNLLTSSSKHKTKDDGKMIGNVKEYFLYD
jgi:hypothetical protein